MPRITPTTDTRDAILNAAKRLVTRDGASKLTLDAVAREAGVSKGGLLYHFGNKEALIFGMLEAELGRFTARLERATDGTPGSWTRAYVQDTLNQPSAAGELETDAALIAAVSENPELLEPFRNATRAWQARSESDGLEPVLATIIRLATDGLYFNELFNMGELRPELRRRVLERLLEMASARDEVSRKNLSRGRGSR